MENFVNKQSIVREIWGKSDTILFIFAGASAEFALNKAVDWLYFTGKLPKDPLGRLFSTVKYARHIVFSENDAAYQAINAINNAHGHVESQRGKSIPDWAYKDVLYMLIDYSVKAYELLELPLTNSEKQEVLNVFIKVGEGMRLENLPHSYSEFETERAKHLKGNLVFGPFTKDLYKQYRKHLGIVRYTLLLETQILLLPEHARQLLKLRSFSLLKPILSIYKISRNLNLDNFIKNLLLPPAYKKDIEAMNYSA